MKSDLHPTCIMQSRKMFIRESNFFLKSCVWDMHFDKVFVKKSRSIVHNPYFSVLLVLTTCSLEVYLQRFWNHLQTSPPTFLPVLVTHSDYLSLRIKGRSANHHFLGDTCDVCLLPRYLKAFQLRTVDDFGQAFLLVPVCLQIQNSADVGSNTRHQSILVFAFSERLGMPKFAET